MSSPTPNRPIRVLRVSVTDRCDRRCVYCMPEQGVALYAHEDMLRLEEIVEITRLLAERFGVERVRLTGGEPLLRRNVVHLVEMLCGLGLEQVLLTTNGRLLAELAARLKAAGLTRVNVSLDSLDSETYARITRGGELSRVLEGIDAARDAGLSPIKLNTVVMRGENDGELCGLVRFAMEKGAAVRFLELINIGAAVDLHADRFVSIDEMLAILRGEFEVESLPREHTGPAMSHLLTCRRTGQQVRIGTIASESQPFCSCCDRLRLTSRGELRACLMSDAGADLRAWVRTPEQDAREFDRVVRSVVAMKPALRRQQARHPMSKIGG